MDEINLKNGTLLCRKTEKIRCNMTQIENVSKVRKPGNDRKISRTINTNVYGLLTGISSILLLGLMIILIAGTAEPHENESVTKIAQEPLVEAFDIKDNLEVQKGIFRDVLHLNKINCKFKEIGHLRINKYV